MSIVPFSLEVAEQLYNSTQEFPVDFDDAWVWLDYSRKDNAKVAFNKFGFEKGVDFQALKLQELRPQGGYSNLEEIKLTVDCFKHWAMMSRTKVGKQVRNYFIKCEHQLKVYVRWHKEMKENEKRNIFDPVVELERFAESLERVSRFTDVQFTNPAMQQAMKDYIGNRFIEANQAKLSPSKDNWMGAVNYCEGVLGRKVPVNGAHCRTNLGAWLRCFYPELTNRQETRLCNETQKNIWVYPIHLEQVATGLKQAIEEFFSTAKPTQAIAKTGYYKQKK